VGERCSRRVCYSAGFAAPADSTAPAPVAPLGQPDLPGLGVQIVPASFGSEYAGAVRVYPQVAAVAVSSLA
jgi:hypothetical protein